MQPGEFWVLDFVLLHPEVCLGFPVIGLLVLTEPRVGQGQEHEIKACASPGQGDRSFQGGDRVGIVTGSIISSAQGVPVGGRLRVCLSRLDSQTDCELGISHAGIRLVDQEPGKVIGTIPSLPLNPGQVGMDRGDLGQQIEGVDPGDSVFGTLTLLFEGSGKSLVTIGQPFLGCCGCR